MRSWRQLVFLLAVVAPMANGGEMVDRIVAQVDHRVILQSEVEDSLRYQALVAGGEPERFTADQRKQAIEGLVDRLLIGEQIDRSSFVRASREDVDRQVGELRKTLSATDEQAWHALLARYSLSEDDVRTLLAEQLDILHYVDERFRANIHIDQRSIESYYLEQLIPQLHRSGAHEVPLAQVSGKIEEILVQQRMNELMTLWLRNLRLQEQVHLR